MEKPNSWRTILPQFQELRPVTPTRKISYLQHRSQVSELLNQNSVVKEVTPRKVQQRNVSSQDNPLVATSISPMAKVGLRTPIKNRISKENPLNYKFQPSLSARLVKTKVTESRVSCLTMSVKEASPPRVVKIKNSETYLDFLPGSMYKKVQDKTKTIVKVFKEKNMCSVGDIKGTNKRIKTNKLYNKFSINDQYS